jgi:ribosomal protein S6E (S10)
MATGNAALGAELLNRDRYARQRQFEDLGFAQAAQGQDLGRQFQNVGNQLAADQSNQGAAMQAEVANLQARYNAAVQQGNWEQAAAIQNQSANLQAQMSNQQTAFNTGQFNAANQQSMGLANMQALNQGGQFNAANQQQANLANQQTQFGREQVISGNTQQANLANMQASNNMAQFNAGQETGADQYNMTLLGTSAQMADAKVADNLALDKEAFNFSMATDPKVLLSGMTAPMADTTNAVAGLSGVNIPMQYTGGNIGGGGTDWVAAAATGVQAGADIYSASDRRMKKDIKQVGGKDALGLKTYQFRFKGEPDNAPKRTGYMAQDVKKVLPEAVRTFNHKGEKRLAIKPRVIGQALTEALAEQQRGMFAKGYTVGGGL